MDDNLGVAIRSKINESKVAINDYVDTVRAIVGFVNLHCLDPNGYRLRPDTKRFQGRRLTRRQPKEEAAEAFCCPDFGIVIKDWGILGEVDLPPENSNTWN